MKKILLLFLLTGLVCACSKAELSDEELLENDKTELQSKLDDESVVLYKLIKMVLRSSKDPDYKKHVGKHGKEFQLFTKLFKKMDSSKELTTNDYLKIATSLKNVRGFVKSTDEDIFPCLSDAIKLQKGKKIKLLNEKAKKKQDSSEHLLMCLFNHFGGGFGQSATLYECSQIESNEFSDSENKTYLQFFKGYVFYKNGLMYLSEQEFTRNIDWIANSKTVDYRSLNYLFWQNRFNKKQSKEFVLAFNYLFRGIVRMSMEREIDKERCAGDLKKFLELAESIQEFRDISIVVEASLHVRNGETDKAISCLRLFQASPNCCLSDRDYIENIIDLLKEGGFAKDTAIDSGFIGNMASQVVSSQLDIIEWKKEAKKYKMTYLNGVFDSMETVEAGLKKVKESTSGKSLKEKGGSIWDDAKDLMN